MAKVKNPHTLSSYFGIDPEALNELGVLDVSLAIDTKLFIDPLLLCESSHSEINSNAVAQYRKHFETVIKFLIATTKLEDVAWRSARRLLQFHEIRGTCLGYGASSIYGSAFGPELTERILRVGKEIVDLGVTEPDLFPAMALFEANIGPDRISDMTTNVIRKALIAFNRRILNELGKTGEEFDITGESGTFLPNPFQKKRMPLILVPTDVLRVLPIAQDWDDIADAAQKNDVLRSQVNAHIGHIWKAKTKRDKGKLRSQVLSSQEAFQTLLDVCHTVPPRAYNVNSDPDGLIKWAHIAKAVTDAFPMDLCRYLQISDIDTLNELVGKIINQFKNMIENNGLNKELYKDKDKPKHESTAQRLFFAIAYCYCEANNVDISPEVDSGSGQVDFKMSKGFDTKVLVETKLSTNTKLIHGYESQLETYKNAEKTMRAYYVVIDVGRMGKKDEMLLKVKNDAASRFEPLSEIVFIDGIVRASASKR